MKTGIAGLIARWFPAGSSGSEYRASLREFYRHRTEYHRMTTDGDKASEPHALLLGCLLEQGAIYAEVGCGGGAVCRMVAGTALAVGVDVSEIALNNAAETAGSSNTRFVCADAEALPLSDDVVSGCFSFETLEHVWDPLAALSEMIRITKPGGFILISVPNAFSLDLHMEKSLTARLADIAFACARYVADRITRRAFVNVVPRIGGDVFPDCDMVSAVIPANFARAMRRMGCEVDFWDTTFMCAHREGSRTNLDFQKNTARPFVKHFGDHILMLAYKREKSEVR